MNANEQANYAEMIEVPVNTCTVTSIPAPKKRIKRKKQVDDEAVKASVIDVVNKRQEDLFSDEFNPFSEEEKQAVIDAVKNKNLADDNRLETTPQTEVAPLENEVKTEQDFYNEEVAVTSALLGQEVAPQSNENSAPSVSTLTIKDRKKKPSVKGKILGVSLVVGVVAVATVGGAMLTDSLGLTGYFNGVFSANDNTQVLEYDDYTASLPCGAGAEISLTDGVMNITHKGSVYASTDGKVSKIVKEGETFLIEITHGEDFKTVISGIDHAYVAEGEQVFGNIPVGYSNGNGYTVCLYSADGLITEYDISGGTVVWKSTTDGETAS